MNGSMSRSGVALGSQCDTDEPGWAGFGVYTSTRPESSAPARNAGFVLIVTCTLFASWALMALPSAWVRLTVGIVIEASTPLMSGGGPDALLTIITAIAPAACAAC